MLKRTVLFRVMVVATSVIMLLWMFYPTIHHYRNILDPAVGLKSPGSKEPAVGLKSPGSKDPAVGLKPPGSKDPASETSTTSSVSIIPYNASSPIPRILHQVFISSEMVFENYKPLIQSCLTLNPDWTYYMWRDRDADALIADKYPEFLAQYRRYTDVLEKSDSIRYVALHHFGGIYLDMDVECKKPFFPSLSGINSFLDQERIEQANILGRPFTVVNAAMGSAPGHPFFRLIINKIGAVKNVGHAFYTTGPEILTDVYNNYINSKPMIPKLLDPKVMSPSMDVGFDWKKNCAGHLNDKKPINQRSLKERGCLMLQSKNWRIDETDNSTICIHRFLHLGYAIHASGRKKLFNLTKEFWPRVNFYT